MKKFTLFACVAAVFAVGHIYAYADALRDWSDYESALRKGALTSADAEHQAKSLVSKLEEFAKDKNITENEQWFFPVEGFSKKNVKNIKKVISAMGENVRDTKFTDGMQFLVAENLRLIISLTKEEKKEIKKNKDSQEGATEGIVKNKSTANVLAANNGLVIYVKKGALNSAGGNTVWLYNPAQNFFIYYGMLRTVDVSVGDIVMAGDKIGTIKAQGDSFVLHFGVMMYGDEAFTLFNYFDEME